jgi:DNA-binding transcriptional regulator/RsmH inhibitor MraZ
VLALTTPFTPDAQHRISVGPKLRSRIGLEREVTIVGQGTHAAIYPSAVWEALEAASTAPDESGLALEDKFDRLEHL